MAAEVGASVAAWVALDASVAAGSVAAGAWVAGGSVSSRRLCDVVPPPPQAARNKLNMMRAAMN